MERLIEKIDESHDRQICYMQGTDEMAKMLRILPNPCPSTHELHYQWEEDPEGKRLPRVVIELRERQRNAAAGTATAEPAKKELTANDLGALFRAGELQLHHLSRANDGHVATLAAELGIKLTGKASRAQASAAIMEAAEKQKKPE